MPAIGSGPDDRPIVHPFSIYKLDGQKGGYLDDFRAVVLNTSQARGRRETGPNGGSRCGLI